MNAVWKFELHRDDCKIDMPAGARILNVAAQVDRIFLWALVDVEKPEEGRTFRTVGTGEGFDAEGLTYVGTAHNVGGFMVFHVFEAAT